MVRVLSATGQEVSVQKFKMPKKPAGSASLAQKVKKLEKQVRQGKEEWKSLDTVQTVTPMIAAGVLTFIEWVLPWRQLKQS